MQRYYEQFDTCREHDIPFCSDACPFKLDVLTLQERIVKDRFNAAYKSLRDAVVFPEIVSELCPAYCENACVRKAIDSPVQINALEKSIIANATKKTPNKYNLPARKQRVAVIGAGLSGMGFAFRMASKKYDVTVYEKSDKVGGHLAELMDETVYMEEFSRQFENEKYTLKLNTPITDLRALCKESAESSEAGFDVIYIATGKGGDSFGIPMPGEDEKCGCQLMAGTAVLVGGELCGKDLMFGLADGLNLAVAAEKFLKTGTLELPATSEPTKCVADMDKLVHTPAIPSKSTQLTAEECKAEAERCIRCQCDACMRNCDLVDYYEKVPIKMRDEIFLSCKPAGSLVHKSPARKYVAACTMCGMMEETCPEHIDLCGMVKYARHKMHEADKVPAAYRQFFIRDMDFANGPYASLKRTIDACDIDSGAGVKYAFFPGCNLGALDPDYVIKPYKWLLEKMPQTSILLRCCSIPVDWNGDTELHNEEINKLKQDWIDLGQPTLITACMSCQKHINEYLPEINTVSLYEVLDQYDFKPEESFKNNNLEKTADEPFAIFDPCSARNKGQVQSSVRNLISGAGISAEELPKGDQHGCCGFGGMGSIAAPGFTEYVAQKRSEITDSPYIVYCSNCRDIFADRDKKAVHLLDILFDIDPEGIRPQPDVTARRRNRIILKNRLLNEIWKEDTDMTPYENPFPLFISEEVCSKVNKLKILEEDICTVISNAQTTGRKTIDKQTGHYIAYREIGHITCWVEFNPSEDGYEIHNVYTHRMKIELEAVWNGRKTDTDM